MTSLQILQYSLYNDDNYKSILNVTINDIISKYNLVIIEYFKLKITGVREIIRGLDTISHVFEIMILYTKNLDMTYYHSQKAFYFYGDDVPSSGTKPSRIEPRFSRHVWLIGHLNPMEFEQATNSNEICELTCLCCGSFRQFGH